METVNAVGRRKAAVARVILKEGTGVITINKRPLEVYFPSSILQFIVKQPLSTLEVGAKEAANKLGVNLTTQDANNDSSLLLQYIEASRNAGEDAIIINVVDPETVPQCIEAAGDMKVVFVNRQPTDNSLLTENAVYVGSREVDAGHYQAEYLANYFKEQGKSEIKYILLNGQIGNDSTTNRTIGVLEGLESAGITATEASAPLAADWDRAEAMNMISPAADYN